jgi:hypothetical protein
MHTERERERERERRGEGGREGGRGGAHTCMLTRMINAPENVAHFATSEECHLSSHLLLVMTSLIYPIVMQEGTWVTFECRVVYPNSQLSVPPLPHVDVPGGPRFVLDSRIPKQDCMSIGPALRPSPGSCHQISQLYHTFC